MSFTIGLTSEAGTMTRIPEKDIDTCSDKLGVAALLQTAGVCIVQYPYGYGLESRRGSS
jgi:hypothetical protein